MSDLPPLEPRDMQVMAIVGPTATGKTALAIELARHFDGEVVNADSMQLYAGMDIGTAKPDIVERAGVPHHLLDVWPIAQAASVARYQELARVAITEISSRGRVPILVGGSGLYIRAALDQLEFPGQSPELRQVLYAELDELGPAALHRRLTTLDPDAAATILPSNGRRIARALEVIELTGQPYSATLPTHDSIYRTAFVGLDRTDLDDRVEQRVTAMMNAGLVDEVRALLGFGLRGSPTAGKALGYAQLLTCLDDSGVVVGDLGMAVSETIRTTRRFVRRQRSWFRRDPRISWIDGAASDLVARCRAAIALTLE
jgi:tRNA dimethylallyltransferase